MNRIYGVASCFLGSLGMALLVVSILLVPQSRALAGTGGAVCAGPNTCDFGTKCLIEYPVCPNQCRDGGKERWCKCDSSPSSCADCICKLGVNQCGCYLP
jgi:hypothetical protein